MDLDVDGQVGAVDYAYEEMVSHTVSGAASYRQCPDNSVDVVLSTCETSIPTAVRGIRDAASAARNAGYKVRTLYGSSENVSAVLNWLSCSNLVGFGRIGHGLQNAFMVADGQVTYQHFRSMGSQSLNSKVIFLNSCLTHNNPLEGSIVGAGVQKYIGGDTTLGIGTSEPVFSCWHRRALSGNSTISGALNYCVQNATSGFPGVYGISGSGSNQYPRVSGNTNDNDNDNNDSSCQDRNSNCAYWANHGECTKNPGYMLVYCCASCQNVSNGSGSDCQDHNRHCDYWANHGECTKNPGYMLTYCCASCRNQ
jgi:hypothetical protein